MVGFRLHAQESAIYSHCLRIAKTLEQCDTPHAVYGGQRFLHRRQTITAQMFKFKAFLKVLLWESSNQQRAKKSDKRAQAAQGRYPREAVCERLAVSRENPGG